MECSCTVSSWDVIFSLLLSSMQVKLLMLFTYCLDSCQKQREKKVNQIKVIKSWTWQWLNLKRLIEWINYNMKKSTFKMFINRQQTSNVTFYLLVLWLFWLSLSFSSSYMKYNQHRQVNIRYNCNATKIVKIHTCVCPKKGSQKS